MKTSRMLMIAGGSTVILGAGWAVSPKAVAEQDFLDADGKVLPDGAQVFEGSVESNIKGQYQVEIVVVDGKVTDVNTLRAGSQTPDSIAVNNRALPLLEERMIEAQTWDVEFVSGASFTSPAITDSAKVAFEAAGLA